MITYASVTRTHIVIIEGDSLDEVNKNTSGEMIAIDRPSPVKRPTSAELGEMSRILRQRRGMNSL
jgi:hypothetical protein